MDTALGFIVTMAKIWLAIAISYGLLAIGLIVVSRGMRGAAAVFRAFGRRS